QNLIHLGHGSVTRRGDLRGAAGDDEARARPLPPRAADRLTCLTLGFGCHRAGVDDDGIIEPRGRRLSANHLRFEGVEPAPEGDHVECHEPQPGSREGSSVPVKLTATGPAMVTWPSSRHSISSVPPSAITSALRSARLRRWAATIAAQAPLPQATVMPTPRSQTRKRSRFGESTWTTPILARSGKSGSRSSLGPSAARSIDSASATK